MARLVDRISFAIIGALALALVAVLAGIADAGPLNPLAGPGSTMRTLDELSGAWSRDLPTAGGCDSARFDCVLGDNAVLDRNTGLVWDRSPFPANPYFTAIVGCLTSDEGGVMGWRLATAAELLTLVKPGATNPALPAEHPFINPLNVDYWTATFTPGSSTLLIGVNMGTGGLTTTLNSTSGNAPYWCVRGPL